MRIRVGESWKHNEAWRRSLEALAEGQSRGFSPRDIVDVLSFELEGVDIAQGRAEGSLLDVLGALVRAARSLLNGDGNERVSFVVGGNELRLSREGPELALVFVPSGETEPLSPPVRVLPSPFLRAVQQAARGFVDELCALHPSLGSLRLVEELLRDVEAPMRRRRTPSASARRSLTPLATPFPLADAVSLGSLRLGIRAERQALVVVDEDRRRFVWSRPGDPAPSLVALARSIGSLTPVDDVVIDARLRTVRFGRGSEVPLSSLRTALLELAERIDDEVRAQVHAALEERPEPESVRARMLASTEPAVSESKGPLSPGLPSKGLRRLILRRSWRVDAPGRRPRLTPCAEGVLVSTPEGAELRSLEGRSLWSKPLLDAFVVGEFVVGRDAQGALQLVEAATGEGRGRAKTVCSPLRSAFSLSNGAVSVHDGTRLVTMLPDEPGSAWTFETPGASRLVAAPAWSGIVVGTDRGELLTLDVEGKTVWQRRTPLSLVEHLCVDPSLGLVAALGLDESGRVGLCVSSLSDGRELQSRAFDGLRPTEPLLLEDALVFGYETIAGPVLEACRLSEPRTLWKVEPPDEGHAVPVACGESIAVARSGGGVALYSREGTLLWQQSSLDPDPTLSPVRPRRPVVGDALMLVSGALVHVLDVSSGRCIASAEPAELAPDSACILKGPLVVVAGRDGMIDAWRTGGHLAVVS